MDSAVFMERYGYKLLLGLSLFIIIIVAAATVGVIGGLLAEFGTITAAVILMGIVIYVLLSRGRTKDEIGEMERRRNEEGLKRY